MTLHPVTLFAAIASCAVSFIPSVADASSAETSLTPPGAPAPVLRSLDQIEPRTPISEPCIITQPGSYYLTGNITTTSYGITIRTNNVTLDLMGYTLSGDRGASDYGIWVDGSSTAIRSGVCIRNGTVSTFGYGVLLGNARGCRLENIACTTNLNHGIYLRGDSGICKDNILRHCLSIANGFGIVLGATSSGACEGNRITDCLVERNGAYGVILNGNGGSCTFNEVLSSVIRDNKNNGVFMDGSFSGFCFGNTIRNCLINNNGQNGVDMQAYQGTCSGNRIINCGLGANSLYGLYVYYASENCFWGNNLSASGTANLATESSSGNYILQNASFGAPASYIVDINQAYGPLVTAAGELSITGSAAHPWANFSR